MAERARTPVMSLGEIVQPVCDREHPQHFQPAFSWNHIAVATGRQA